MTGSDEAILYCNIYCVVDDNHLWLMITYRYSGRSLGHVSSGSGQIWLDNVQCRGTETDIASCPHNGWGSHNCFHIEDISVRCTGAPTIGMITSRCGLKQ